MTKLRDASVAWAARRRSSTADPDRALPLPPCPHPTRSITPPSNATQPRARRRIKGLRGLTNQIVRQSPILDLGTRSHGAFHPRAEPELEWHIRDWALALTPAAVGIPCSPQG